MGTSSRLPSWQQIAQVYAIMVLMLYGWTMMWFLWKLPSWVGFLTVGEVLAVLAYSLSINLIESIAALGAPVLLGLLLPRNWFQDAFVARGAALSMTGLGAMMFMANQFRNRDELPGVLMGNWQTALILLGIGAVVFLAGRIGLLRRAVEVLADRATIFLYASVPLSVLSVLVIGVRWLR